MCGFPKPPARITGRGREASEVGIMRGAPPGWRVCRTWGMRGLEERLVSMKRVKKGGI